MDQRILEFIGDLRRAEMRISPSEALDALAASAEIGLGGPRDLQERARQPRSSRSRATSPTFDRIFDLYFLDLQALGAGLKKALGPEDPKIQEMLDQPACRRTGIEMDEHDRAHAPRRGRGDGDGHPPGQGQSAGLERLMYFLQIGYFSRRIYDKFDWEAIERDLAASCRCWRRKGPRSRACSRASATTSTCASRPSAA